MSKLPSKSEVLNVATKAIKIFSRNGLESCLVGGVACSLYGNTRTPTDVDLLVMTSSLQQEQLKGILVRSDPCFYLIAAKTPGAKYQVLWYRLIGYRRSCKVDILVPGVMNIPTVPSASIKVIDGLSAMPFSGVFFLKIQAWTDHRASDRAFMREKQYVDVGDILKLLELAICQRLRPATDVWLPSSFVSVSKERVKEFILMYGGAEDWKKIGLA